MLRSTLAMQMHNRDHKHQEWNEYMYKVSPNTL
jgi:hypothetical protein